MCRAPKHPSKFQHSPSWSYHISASNNVSGGFETSHFNLACGIAEDFFDLLRSHRSQAKQFRYSTKNTHAAEVDERVILEQMELLKGSRVVATAIRKKTCEAQGT